MQTTLKLIIPSRNRKGEIVPDSHLIIDADKHDQAIITLTTAERPEETITALISADDLKVAAADLWLFLKR